MTMKSPVPARTKTQSALPVEVIPMIPWREIVPLSRVLSSINRDSRTEPQIYLDEVVVPHGGE
jgi:hypothetical protein